MTQRRQDQPGQSHYRRRPHVSLSAPTLAIEPVEHLDHATEIIHRTNRALAATAPDHEELIALAGLLTQITGGLLTLTELLMTSISRRDPTLLAQDGTRPHAALGPLEDCRNSYYIARTTARAVHAHLKCRGTVTVLSAGHMRLGSDGQ